jgi:ribosomal protein L35AE/L33A
VSTWCSKDGRKIIRGSVVRGHGSDDIVTITRERVVKDMIERMV